MFLFSWGQELSWCCPQELEPAFFPCGEEDNRATAKAELYMSLFARRLVDAALKKRYKLFFFSGMPSDVAHSKRMGVQMLSFEGIRQLQLPYREGVTMAFGR